MKVHNQEKVSCSSIQRINKRLKYIGSNQRRFAHTLDSILVCMCAKRMVKGSGYISPVKRRIIAVEWHDHTDKVRKRKTGGKTKDGGGEWGGDTHGLEGMEARNLRCGEERQQVHSEQASFQYYVKTLLAVSFRFVQE